MLQQDTRRRFTHDHHAHSTRSPYISSRPLPPSSPTSPIDDVLVPGDVVGDGFYLQGELLTSHSDHPPQQFEVIKQLGTGSYAVVYLVQEVLSRPQPSDDGHMSTIGAMDFDNPQQVVYGTKYAIKCLSKADLDDDALAVQMSEVTIHQSLPLHPNIVSLHRTLETSSFLLLLLEYVPGEDLFYFLEQARDHYQLDPTDSSVSTSHTPPTPSLLSNLNPAHLLSKTRLRLISSMFSQMCDAVAVCHNHNVYHRDIKPENFIVTDGHVLTPDGRSERKVIVKLTDFGLSTTDLESADMDCGSAPYMSYECRNNVAPTYRPRAADVWSLGIVLINMLYHFNPWTDTAQGACSSFDIYRKDPSHFFMTRFMGMTRPVADVLANKVFCILEDPHDDSSRMGAAEFGAWARNLPTLLGTHGVHRTVSSGSTQGHRISLHMPLSHRPQSRHPSGSTAAGRTPASASAVSPRTLSRAPSFEPAFERQELSVVIDEDDVDDNEGDVEIEGMTSRSTSTTKRRKRGARKGKGAVAVAAAAAVDNTLATLADASQSLAREISMASKSSSHRSASRTKKPFEPVSMYAVPSALFSRPPPALVVQPIMVAPTPAPVPTPVTKKPSKWKLSFGKNSATALAATAAAAAVNPPQLMEEPIDAMTTTASNVTSLLMGLNAPVAQAAVSTVSSSPYGNNAVGASSSSFSLPRSEGNMDAGGATWSRGRRGVRDPSPLGPNNNNNHSRPQQYVPPARKGSRSPGYALSATSPHARSHGSLNLNHQHPLPPHPMPGVPAPEPWAATNRDGAVSPNSGHVRRHPAPNGNGHPHAHTHTHAASSASSVVSANWRSSMSTSSSAGTSTSAFTRYSNSSARSVSTTATSVSSASWRTSVKTSGSGQGSTGQGRGEGHGNGAQGYAQGVPKNIKIMDGVPWELDQLPRGQHPNPVGDIFGSPPVRKPRTRKTPPADLKLDTINERPTMTKSAAIQAQAGLQQQANHQHQHQHQLQANHQQHSYQHNQPLTTQQFVAPPHQPLQQLQPLHINNPSPLAQQQQRQRPAKSPLSSPLSAVHAQPYMRRDASTSTTDLARVHRDGKEEGEGAKKVQKAQINTLAKLLSAMTGNGRK